MKRFGEKMVFNYTITNDEEGYVGVKRKRLAYTGEYTKLYNNAFTVIVECSRCAQLLFLFLTTKMDNKGTVYSNTVTRNEFLLYVYEKYGKNLFTEDTIKVAFKELKDKELLIPYVRGIMYINPVYFWRGDNNSRKEAAQAIYANKYNGLKVSIE